MGQADYDENHDRLVDAFDKITNQAHSNPDWAASDNLHGVGVSNFAIANALHDVADAIREGNTPRPCGMEINVEGAPTEADVFEFTRYNKGGNLA